LTETSASAGEFVTIGRGKFFEDDQAATIDAVARQIIGQRTELQESMAREAIAARVLPSLTGFDVAIDVRFAFTDDQIEVRWPRSFGQPSGLVKLIPGLPHAASLVVAGSLVGPGQGNDCTNP
jgi:hypothetical protein